MRSLLAAMLWLALLARLARGQPGWECGSENDGLAGLSKGASHFFLTVNCPNLRDAVNNCCVTHDNCYERQLGRGKCDSTFCGCMSDAVKRDRRCRKLREVMCKAVQDHGGPAYLASGK